VKSVPVPIPLPLPFSFKVPCPFPLPEGQAACNIPGRWDPTWAPMGLEDSMMRRSTYVVRGVAPAASIPEPFTLPWWAVPDRTAIVWGARARVPHWQLTQMGWDATWSTPASILQKQDGFRRKMFCMDCLMPTAHTREALPSPNPYPPCLQSPEICVLRGTGLVRDGPQVGRTQTRAIRRALQASTGVLQEQVVGLLHRAKRHDKQTPTFTAPPFFKPSSLLLTASRRRTEPRIPGLSPSSRLVHPRPQFA
jgi:hypothetical protein